MAQIDRQALSVDTFGMQLEEAKQLLQQEQSVLIDQQARTSLAQLGQLGAVNSDYA
jgi:hypothetical protein